MSSNFALNDRKIHEMKARPAVEKTLRAAFTEKGVNIARITWTDEKHEDGLLFEKAGIDGAIYLFGGGRLTFQAKALTPWEARWGTITVEYYNDPTTKLEGDWFTCMAQIYICGYTLEDYSSMRPWAVVNYPALKMATVQGRLKWGVRGNTKSSARANFKYIEIDKLPEDVLIARLSPQPPPLLLPARVPSSAPDVLALPAPVDKAA